MRSLYDNFKNNHKKFNNWIENAEMDGKLTKNIDENDSFYKSFSPVVLLAQIFALFPISGARGKTYKDVSFKWKSCKCLYCIVVTSIITMMLIFAIASSVEDGLTYETLDGVIFFSNAVASSLVFLQLAQKWPVLVKKWYVADEKLEDYGYPKKIGFKTKLHMTIFMIAAIGEHALSRAKTIVKMINCADVKINFFSVLKAFCFWNGSTDFHYIPYNPFTGLVILLGKSAATFTWSFNNLFLSLISFQLSARFKQINERLEQHLDQKTNAQFWKKTREEYNTLANLTREVDTRVQKLVVLAFGLNLYYICLQLSKGLRSKSNVYQIAYFFYSLVFLIYRTCMLSLSAASIHDESKRPLSVLYSVPDKSYSFEVKRFLDQVINEDIVLTGCRFFSVTRSLLLTIAGTIVTYEIVLVQFNPHQVDENWTEELNVTFCDDF